MTEPVEQALPGGHDEHCNWSARLVALLKLPFWHGSGADAPTGQTEPGWHGWQDVEFLSRWYVPPLHGLHSDAPSSLLIEPGLQAAGLMEPVEHALPGGHKRHCD
mgnify:CR=1 FL=1